MRRLFRIVGITATVICLALLGVSLRLVGTERVVWWRHAGDLPHHHVAAIRDGKLFLAEYLQTSVSPRDRSYLRNVAEEPLLDARMEECGAYLREIRLRDTRPTNEELTKAAICQAVLTEAAGVRTDLLIYRAYFTLPSKPGMGSETIADRWPSLPLRATTRPANYADNLMRRMNDVAAPLGGHSFLGVSYSNGVLPYGRWWIARVPLWLITPVLLALPLHSAWKSFRSRRRGAKNLCICCGYDLRASPGVCPECGAGG